MKIIPFTVEVAQEFLAQERHTAIGAHLSDGEICKLVGSQSFAGRVDDGSLVAACGIYEMWQGRALSWALMTKQSGRHMAAITRGVSRWLDIQPYRRVEATVEVGFGAGHRWAKMLGFELEAPLLKAYGPNGEDHVLYARVR